MSMGGTVCACLLCFQDLSLLRIGQVCFPQVLLGQTCNNFLWGSDCSNGSITHLWLSMHGTHTSSTGLRPCLRAGMWTISKSQACICFSHLASWFSGFLKLRSQVREPWSVHTMKWCSRSYGQKCWRNVITTSSSLRVMQYLLLALLSTWLAYATTACLSAIILLWEDRPNSIITGIRVQYKEPATASVSAS